MPQYNGVWTLQAQAQALTSQQWVTDPNFKQTTLLLQADNAANGAQNNTFFDSGSNGFAITRSGNTTQGSFTPFSPGWSNYFPTNTTTSQTTLTSSVTAFGTGNFTIEFNYYLIAHASGSIGQIYESGTNGIGILVENTNQLRVFQRDGAGTSTTLIASGTATAIPVNAWSYIALVRTGTGANQLTLYINGSSVGTGTSSANYTSTTGYINGRYTGANYFPVICYISNLRVSTTNRTITVPTAFYTSDANTTLLTCISNRFVNVANGNALTVLSTATVEPSVQAFAPFAPQYQWTAPVIGGSGYFDGSSYLTVGGGSSLAFGSGNFSLEMFVYQTSSGTLRKIYDARPSATAGNYPVLDIDVGNVARFLVDSTVLITGTTVIPANTWAHVLVSRVSGNLRLFVNGVQDGSTVSNSTNFANATARPAIAVRGSTLANDFFIGYISSVRVLIGSGFTSVTVPTAPLTAITNTSLLLNFTNAGIFDSTAKNNLETVADAQVSTSIVKYGSGSMYFDGTGDYLTIRNSPILSFGTGDVTVECWVNPIAISGIRTIIDTRVSGAYGNDAFTFQLVDGVFSVYAGAYSGAVALISAGSAVPTAAWTHITFTRANGINRVFVNGALITTNTNAWNQTYVSTTPYYVGQTVGLDRPFNGYIDDLRITNGYARYTANFKPPQVALPRQ